MLLIWRVHVSTSSFIFYLKYCADSFSLRLDQFISSSPLYRVPLSPSIGRHLLESSTIRAHLSFRKSICEEDWSATPTGTCSPFFLPHFAASDPHRVCNNFDFVDVFRWRLSSRSFGIEGDGQKFADQCRWVHALRTPSPKQPPNPRGPPPPASNPFCLFWFGKHICRGTVIYWNRKSSRGSAESQVWIRWVIPQPPNASTLDSRLRYLIRDVFRGLVFFQCWGVNVLLTRGRLAPEHGKIFTKWVNSMPHPDPIKL